MPTGIFQDNETYNQQGGTIWAQQQVQNLQNQWQDGQDWANQQVTNFLSLGTPQSPLPQQSLTSVSPTQDATSPPTSPGPDTEPAAPQSPASSLPVDQSSDGAATAQDLGQQWADQQAQNQKILDSLDTSASIPPPKVTAPPPTTDTATNAQDYGQAWANQQTQNFGTSDSSQTQIPHGPANQSGQIFPLPIRSDNAPTATYHSQGGSDLLSPRGTPVLDMQGGTVQEIYQDKGDHQFGGNAVLIHGTDGLDYYYAHFDQPTYLKVGDQVQAGQQIGVVGNSGNAYQGGKGPTHLHIGIGYGISDGVGADGGLGLNYNAQNLLTQLEDGVPAQQQGQTWPTSPTSPVSAPLSVSKGNVPAGPQPQQPGDLIDQARQAAINAGIDPDIFTRQIQQESGFQPFNPDGTPKKSPAGAIGIAQFMPDTAKGLGIDPTNPQQSLQAAANMDAQNLKKYNGDWSKTLAAYNAGSGSVDQYGGVPPFQETQSYVNTILGGAQGVVQQVGQTVGQGFSDLGTTANNAGQNLLSNGQNLVNAGMQGLNTFGGTAQDLLNQEEGMTGNAWNTSTGLLQQGQNLLNQGSSAANQLSQNLLNQANTGIGTLNSTVNNGLNAAGQGFSNLGTGIQSTPDQYMQQQEINNPNSLYNQQNQALGNFLQSHGLPTPQNTLGAPDPNSPLGQLASGQPTDLGTNAQALWQATQRYEGWKNALVSQANPLANVPVVGGLTTMAGQVALDPTTLAMGPAGSLADLATQGIGNTALQTVARAGLEGAQVGGLYGAAQPGSTPLSTLESAAVGGAFGGGLSGLGQAAPAAARALMSDQAQALLRARQSGAADVNFALGGLPQAFGVGGAEPVTGAGQLGRALDALGAYPDEIAQPIRAFASSVEAPASEVANTIQQWMQQNPLETLPSTTTGATREEVNQAGEQAVSNIADMVTQAQQRGGPYLPAGTMPGQQGLEGMPTDISQTAPTVQPLSDVRYPMDVAPTQNRVLTPEANDLLSSIDAGAPVPPMSRQLRDLAESNGVPVPLTSPTQAAVTADDVINQLRDIRDNPAPYQDMTQAAVAGAAQQAAESRAYRAQQVAQDLAQSNAADQASGLVAPPGTAAQPLGTAPVKGAPDVWQSTMPNTDPNGAPTFGQIFKTYHTGSLVSGVQTATKVAMNSIVAPLWNLTGNGFYDLATFQPSRAQGSLVGAYGTLQDVPQNFMRGFLGAYTKPDSVGMRFAEAGMPVRSAIARVFESPMALHAGLQAASADMIARMELGRMAGNEATRLGLKGYDWFNGVQDLINNPKPGWMDTAMGVGKRASLTGDLGKFGQSMESHINAWGPLGTWIWPVFRIGMNWLTQRVEQSPIGLVGSAIDVAQGLRGEGPYAGASLSDILPALRGETANMSPEARQAFARNPLVHPADTTLDEFGRVQRQPTAPLRERFTNNILGTGVAIGAAFMGASGMITGAGPEDPSERANLEAQGWQPYSVNINGNYVNYQHMPGGLAMALVGNFFDAVNYPTNAEQEQVMAGRTPFGTMQGPNTGATSRIDYAAERYMKSMAELMANPAGLTQVGDMIDAVASGSAPDVVGQALGGTAVGLLPMSGMLSSVASISDPNQRAPQSLNPLALAAQTFSREIPGLREANVPLRQSPLGEALPNPQYGVRGLLPLPSREIAGNPVLAAAAQAGYQMPGPPDSIPYGSGREILLNPSEQRSYQTLKGNMLQQIVAPMIQSGQWQRIDPQTQQSILRNLEPTLNRYAAGMTLASMDGSTAWQRSQPGARNYLFPSVSYEPANLAQNYLGQQALQQQLAQASNFLASRQAAQPLLPANLLA